MAQINVRVSDEDKNAAEEVAKAAGYSLTEYLGLVISYMAEHRTLPVVISYKTVAMKPEEAFQQALIKYRDAYSRVSSLCYDELKPGQMTPLEALREPIDDIESAQRFYEAFERMIAMAPAQLEKSVISNGEYIMFPRCREHFPYIPGFLRTAIRMVNMNNRPIESADLEQMETSLKQAAEHINILQGMLEHEISPSSRIIFFLRDAEEALACARNATAPNEKYMLCLAWENRMDASIRQAKKAYERIGVVPYLNELAMVQKRLEIVKNEVHNYLKRTSEPMRGFETKITDDLSEVLNIAKSKISTLKLA